MKKTVVDCERDVKGIHNFRFVGENTGGGVYWCQQCGAIADETNPKSTGLDRFAVIHRIQEGRQKPRIPHTNRSACRTCRGRNGLHSSLCREL